MGGCVLGHPFPPDITVVGQGDIGEDGIPADGVHRHRIALVRGAGSHAEEPRLGVDRAEPSVGSRLDPGNVVTDAGDFPSLFPEMLGRDDHGEVRLAAGAGEGRSDVGFLARGVLYPEDEHVLGHPSLVASHRRGDAQGEALLSEKGVAAVSGAVAHDQALLGEVRDVGVVGIAGPGNIAAPSLQRETDGVKALHEGAGPRNLRIHGRTHAGHDPHVGHDIGAVGNLDAVLGDGGAEGPHAEGDDVEGAPLHATPEETLELGLHDGGVAPVIRGAGILLGP